MSKNAYLLGFIYTMLLPVLSIAMHGQQDAPIKFKIIAKPNIKHQDVWYGLMTADEENNNAICGAFLAEHVDANVFVGSIGNLPIKGELIKLAIYVGDANMYLAEFPVTKNNSSAKEIVIKWDLSKNKINPYSADNLEIQLTLHDGSTKSAKISPIMLIQNLNYDESLSGKAIELFTKNLFRDLDKHNYTFKY